MARKPLRLNLSEIIPEEEGAAAPQDLEVVSAAQLDSASASGLDAASSPMEHRLTNAFLEEKIQRLEKLLGSGIRRYVSDKGQKLEAILRLCHEELDRRRLARIRKGDEKCETAAQSKAKESSGMGRHRDAGPSAQWDTENTHKYCDLCILEIQKGNRPTTHFNKEGWTNIFRGFSGITSKQYDKTQLKNKWDQLKKEWKLWRDLKHGSTGLGWDPKRETIIASDEWWEEKLKVIPAAKKYKMNGISPDLEEKLNSMFSNVVATGNYVWAPNSGQQPIGLGEGSRDSTKESPTSRGMVDAEQLDSSCGTKRPASSQPKTNIHKKKKVGAANKLVSRLDQLIEATTSMSTGSSSNNAVAKAIETIDSLEEVVQDDEFYWFAIDLIQKNEKLIVFNNLHSTRKLSFLKREYEKSVI